ncbi:MAG TPA: permease-like cell division protein FtsX [Ilumatobacteraceae bacterium]|nr:permease-like cell division protein FtsX [Ilumatobacteraceae bacterium]
MLSRISYVFREMWASLSRNLTLTVAAVVTAAVSLFLSGLTLLIQKGFDNQLAQWTGGVEMIVYVSNDATPENLQLIQQTLEGQPTLIEKVTYCDVQCSVDTAKRLFAGDPTTLEKLTTETIPSYFKIVPVNKDDQVMLAQVATSVRSLPKIQRVATPEKVIATLSTLKGVLGMWTVVMSVALLFASVLLIWNAIRTAMFARRREIEVMKLVGATNWFIRLPFMLEGLLQGLAGGLLGGGLLMVVNNSWTSTVREKFTSDSGLTGFVVTGSTPIWVMLAMVGLGGLVGAIGSATAASRFLDV